MGWSAVVLPVYAAMLLQSYTLAAAVQQVLWNWCTYLPENTAVMRGSLVSSS